MLIHFTAKAEINTGNLIYRIVIAHLSQIICYLAFKTVRKTHQRFRNPCYLAQIPTAKMAGNSRGVGTKDLGCVCFIHFFININPLLKKKGKKGPWSNDITSADNLRGKNTELKIYLYCFLSSGRNRHMQENKIWLTDENHNSFLLASRVFLKGPQAISPALLLVWRSQKTRYNRTGPSSFSIDGGGTCQRSAPSCGTSCQWGRSTPSLPQVLASAEERNNSTSIFCFSPSLLPLPPYLSRNCLVRYLLSWSDQSLPAMDVVHFLRCNPGFGFIIRRNGYSIFPA